MDPLHDTLLRVFGFERFREGQRAVCEALLAGRPTLAVFPTGGGKSLCYQLPALLLPGTTLVISPLIALMKDQVDALRRAGVAAARLDSTLGLEESREVLGALSSGGLRLLYVAPERFLNERFLERLGRTPISLLAIDEAHCISQWGHNFRPDYLKLAEHARALGIHRVLTLTATATPAVVEDIAAAFAIAPPDRIVTSAYRPNLRLEIVPTRASERDRRLAEQPFDGSAIVYVTLQRTAERVAELLRGRGTSARAYHAGMENEERAVVQDAFMSGEVRVIVATIAFGMGIDKSDIREVHHYNLPKGLESYAQEIGRAGRDGAPALCRMLACRDDLAALANFAYGDTPTRDAVAGIVGALFGGPEELAVSLRALSTEHDARELVVKTMLTYLELEGYLKQLTPAYSEYRWKWCRPRGEIVAGFDPARQTFLDRLFDAAVAGPVWQKLDIAGATEALGEPRDRILRALDYLAEKGAIELQASGVLHRMRVLRRPDVHEALIDALTARFEALERNQIARLAEVVAFVEVPGCHTARLLAYFGEQRGPCGHCTGCRGTPVVMPPSDARPSLPERGVVEALVAQHPRALGHPRQVARFLCGITSPALTRARLSRHALFGCAAEADFREVVAWAGGEI